MKSSPSARANFSITASAFPLEVKVGDKVLYAKYAGTEVKIEGETYLIMRESDILAISQ